MDASGHIATERQSELSFRDMLDRGMSADEVIRVRAGEVAQAKHEHAMRMALNEFAYEIRDGRLYSPEYKIYFDEIIDPPAHRRSADYKALPEHVIENLKEAQRLLISGEASKLVILSPNADFAERENSSTGGAYRMRVVGDKVLVTCTEHSTDAAQMLHEAKLLYGLDSSKLLAGNNINGGGVYAVSHDSTPTRQEAADAMRAAGNEKLAQQYEAAIHLGKDVPVADYMTQLVKQEENNIRLMLAARSSDPAADAAAAIREVWKYTEEALQSIKGLSQAGGAASRGIESLESTRQSEFSRENLHFAAAAPTNAQTDFARDRNSQSFSAFGGGALIFEAQSGSAPKNSNAGEAQHAQGRPAFETVTPQLAVMVDHGRFQADPLYRFLKESELQGAYSAREMEGRAARVSGLPESTWIPSATEKYSLLLPQNAAPEIHIPAIAEPIHHRSPEMERAEVVHLREFFAAQEKIRQRAEKIEAVEAAPRFNVEAAQRQIRELSRDIIRHGSRTPTAILKHIAAAAQQTRIHDLPRRTGDFMRTIAQSVNYQLASRAMKKLERELTPSYHEIRRVEKRGSRSARVTPSETRNKNDTNLSKHLKFLTTRERLYTALLQRAQEAVRLQRVYVLHRTGRLSAGEKQKLEKQEPALRARAAVYAAKLETVRKVHAQLKTVLQREKRIERQLERLKATARKIEVRLTAKKELSATAVLERRLAEIEVKFKKLLGMLASVRERKAHIVEHGAPLNRRGRATHVRLSERPVRGNAEGPRQLQKRFERFTKIAAKLDNAAPPAIVERIHRLTARLEHLARLPHGVLRGADPKQLELYAKKLRPLLARLAQSETKVKSTPDASKILKRLTKDERLYATHLHRARETVRMQRTYTRQRAARLPASDKQLLEKQERILHARARVYAAKLKSVRSVRVELKGLLQQEKRIRNKVERFKVVAQKIYARIESKRDGAPVSLLANRVAKIEIKIGNFLAKLGDLYQRKNLVVEGPVRFDRERRLTRLRTSERAPIGNAEGIRRVIVERSALKLLLQRLNKTALKIFLPKLARQIALRITRPMRIRNRNAVQLGASKLRRIEQLQALLMHSQDAVSSEMLRAALENIFETASESSFLKPRSFRLRRRVAQRTDRKIRKRAERDSPLTAPKQEIMRQRHMRSPLPAPGTEQTAINLFTGRRIKAAATAPSLSLDIVRSKEDDDENSGELPDTI